MSSPFPGMDPYLERYWRDVHARLIVYASDQLNPKLPGDLRARAEERIIVDVPRLRPRNIQPGVRFIEPLIFETSDEPVMEIYLKIIDINARDRVVTEIEFLSPSNKIRGDGRNQYLKKQEELNLGRVHSVEIDLLRTGDRVMGGQENIPPEHWSVYQACVRRVGEKDQFEVYPIHLRQRLPRIGIPLRESDPDVVLDLQALIDQAYRNGGYDSI